MAERGERQRLVFELIRLYGFVTSRDLVDAFGISHSGAATELARYQRQGFLHREREPGLGPPVYKYSLNKTGEIKARWWVAQGFGSVLESEQPERSFVKPVIRRESRNVYKPQIYPR